MAVKKPTNKKATSKAKTTAKISNPTQALKALTKVPTIKATSSNTRTQPIKEF